MIFVTPLSYFLISSIIFSALCALPSVLCALRHVLCSLHSVLGALRAVLCALHSVLCALCSAFCAPCSALCLSTTKINFLIFSVWIILRGSESMMEPLVAKNTHLPARVSKFLVFLFRIGARPGSRFLFLVSYLDGEGVYIMYYIYIYIYYCRMVGGSDGQTVG